MTDQIITLDHIETKEEADNVAVIVLSDGSQYNAHRNENGWAAYGTDENGNNWETDDFDTIEELVDDIETFKNEG